MDVMGFLAMGGAKAMLRRFPQMAFFE